MALGIDRQVQDRADKYRQNPAALQKNYQMNNDLLDLLALQSLKSDTDKAKAKIAASMGQNPKTIAEQRGEEAITRTKDDLVEQVGGIAAQQQNTQKQNMQRAAAGAPPSAPPGPPGARPPGPPQQMAGVAGQSAPNMARMAGGGIVSFAGEGDSLVKVTDEQLKAMGITPSAWAGMNERDKALAIRSRLQGDKSLPPVTSELRARKGSMRPGLDAVGQSAADRDLISGEVIRSPADREARGLAAMEAREAERRKGMSAGQLAAMPRMATQTNAPVGADQTNALKAASAEEFGGLKLEQMGFGQQDPTVSPAPAPPLTFPKPTMAGVGGVGAVPTTANRTGTVAGTRASLNADYNPAMDAATNKQRDLADALDPLRKKDSSVAAATQRGVIDKFQDRSGIANIRAEQVRQQQELNAANKASRADSKFYDLLSRAGGQGAFANIGRAASDRRESGLMQDQLDLTNTFARQDQGVKDDLAISDRSITSGDNMAKITAEDRRNATTVQASLFNDIRKGISEKAMMGLTIDTANMTQEQSAAKIATQLAVAELGAKSRIVAAQFNGEIQMRGQDIQKLASETKDREILLKLANNIDKLIAEVNAGISKSANDAIKDDLKGMNLEGPARTNYIKDKLAIFKKAQAGTLESLNLRREFILGRVQGAFSQPGATPSAGDGFSNRTRTSAGS
tara:strand:- start:2373 stop:4424 length:2052 start_codon:yes stop_codon:yes gene_type:complete